MLHRAKLLLVLLVLAALPLRGYADAVMQLCGPAQHGEAGSGAAVDVRAAHHADSQERGASMHEMHAEDGHDLGDPQDGPSACSACDACCAGAAAESGPRLSFEHPAAEVIAFLGLPVSGVTLENPERPPSPLVR